jgi:hypothetical protein
MGHRPAAFAGPEGLLIACRGYGSMRSGSSGSFFKKRLFQAFFRTICVVRPVNTGERCYQIKSMMLLARSIFTRQGKACSIGRHTAAAI